MILSFVVFRYQPDLKKDEWVPLGVVAECPFDNGTEIGVMCLGGVEIEGSSELAAAMLNDAPSVLSKEVQNTRARLRSEEDFLEVLRAQSPWNFHFTVPQTQNLQAEDLQQATMELFYRHVLRRPAPQNSEAKREPSTAIKPRRMESYEVAV